MHRRLSDPRYDSKRFATADTARRPRERVLNDDDDLTDNGPARGIQPDHRSSGDYDVLARCYGSTQNRTPGFLRSESEESPTVPRRR